MPRPHQGGVPKPTLPRLCDVSLSPPLSLRAAGREGLSHSLKALCPRGAPRPPSQKPLLLTDPQICRRGSCPRDPGLRCHCLFILACLHLTYSCILMYFHLFISAGDPSQGLTQARLAVTTVLLFIYFSSPIVRTDHTSC